MGHFNTAVTQIQTFPLEVSCLENPAPAGVVHWIELQPENQMVTDWIPSQGTCLGYWPGPQ